MSESCIISLDGLHTKPAERRFMLAFLDAIYCNADGDPFNMVFDEAALWAPQKLSEPMLQSRMEEIGRCGRIKGFIPSLIRQRPAVLSKDLLSHDHDARAALQQSLDRAGRVVGLAAAAAAGVDGAQAVIQRGIGDWERAHHPPPQRQGPRLD